MNSTTEIAVKVTHIFNAPREAVFDAWIASERIRQWFAPGLGEMVRVALDARVGGSFSFVQRRGMADVDHIGKYLELDRPQRLAFTWQVRGTSDTSRVFIDIVPKNEGCELTLVHELAPSWADYKDKTAAAWTKMLNAMAVAIRSA
jgi:uncharacterized protein YndB with AHSA1/START domain